MGWLRNRTGRIRLGWRLASFLVLTAFLAGGLSFVPFPGPGAEGLPLLLGTLVAGWVLLWLDGRRPGALGFYLAPAALRESILGLGLGMILVLAGVLVIWSGGGVRWSPDTGTLSGFLSMAAESLWFFVVFGALEEALLRGYVLQAMAESWGSLAALWITSVAFSALHLANPNLNLVGLLNILVAGLLLGVVYLKTASLWWATGVHVGWNWAQAFWADLPTSGIDPFDTPFLEPSSAGPAWLSGGGFGPEGSLVMTGIAGIATWALWRAGWPEPSQAALDKQPLIFSRNGTETGAGREESG